MGVDGDANSQCSDPNALKRTGDTCSTDDDCITNYCSDESICSERNKECMNECSPELGAGTCVFRSIIDNSVLSECAQSATTCRAVCEDCTSGYYGLDCSLSQSDYDSKVALRDTLCASIYDTVVIQDITEDVMKSRCTTLSGLLKDPSQLSSEAISNCTSALVLTIEASPEYAGLDTVSSLAAQTLSKVLNLPLGAGLLLNVSETLKSLTGSVQDNLAVGEAQKDFNTDNARIGAQVLDPSALASTTFSPPQSDTEKFNGAPINNLSVEMGSSVSAVGISVVQYNNNPTGSVTDNIPIAIQTTDYASARRRRRRLQHLPPGAIEMEDGDNLAIAGRRRRLSSSGSNTVTLQLKNNEDVTYFSIPENSSWVFCEDLPYDYNETVSCPAINATSYETYYVNFTFECFKNSPRNYSYTCPASEKLPECKTYDGVDFTVDSSCTLKSYTAKETICECNVDNDGGRRLTEYDELGRRLSVSAAAKSELRQFSATAGILGGSFVKTVNVVNTFNADDDPNNKKSPGEKFVRVVSGNAVIFFFMLTIVIITIVGILLTALKDRVEVKRWAEQLVSTKETRDKIVAARDITKFVNDAMPLEFTGIPWHIRFWKRMTEEHDWLACFLPYKESHAESWAQFTMGMGKVCNFLFVDTILSALFFADDGTCETFQTEEDCLFLRALSQVDSLCEWEFDYDTFYNATVYYNVSVENPVYNGTDLSILFGSCSFSGASSEFMPTLILVIVITIFTIPFDRIVEFLAGETAALFCVEKAMVKVAEEEHKKEQENNEGGESRVLQQSRKRAAGGDPGEEEEEDDEIEDEKLIELARNTTSFDFAVYAREIDNLQSYAGTLMRAARLVVMQRDIDDVDSETEASHLVEGKSGGMDKHVDATKYMRSGHRNTANPFMMVYNAIQHLYLNKEDHGFCDTGADLVVAERVGGYKGVVLSAVRRARERADEIIEDMEKLEDESKKDIMLLQRFVIDSLKGISAILH